MSGYITRGPRWPVKSARRIRIELWWHRYQDAVRVALIASGVVLLIVAAALTRWFFGQQ